MPLAEPVRSSSTLRIVAALSLILVSAACSSSPSSGAISTPSAASSGVPSAPGAKQTPVPVESNPPGDIPDSVAYILYRNPKGGYEFRHPEGWTILTAGASVTLTDKLNGIAAHSTAASAAPTVADARREATALSATQAAFELRSVTAAALPGGSGVLIVFRRNSAPDSVTGRVYRDEVNRYEIFRAGRLVTLDLYGAVGSDNVDPYRKISQSLVIA
jgi:hypothetical protein